nr:DUF3226 domain-containing protein [Desulfonema limicola]
MLQYEKINNIQVIDIGGKDKFKIELSLLLNLEGFSEVHTLGFVRDAEENQADSAFSSICSVLNKNRLPAPKTINSINNEQNIKVGVFIMPNNIDKGMLEDLCIESVKANPVFECVNQYIECCLLRFPENEKNINLSKAKIQTYLAVKNPIVNSLGLAAAKGYWDFSEKCFSEIRKFICNLFWSDAPINAPLKQN